MASVLARACLSQRLACTAGFARPLVRPIFHSSARPVAQRGFCAESQSGSQNPWQRFWQWTTQQRPHWRESYYEAAVIFCVFGCVGSTSVRICRPMIQSYVVDGTMKDGPWSYRIANVVLVTPVYLCVLVTFGTIAGRNVFFTGMAKRIMGHFVPPSFRPKLGLELPKAAASSTTKAAADNTAKVAAAPATKATGEAATKVASEGATKAAGGAAGTAPVPPPV